MSNPLPSASERGASALLIAASLFMLIGFVAISVDTGLIYNERRQEQGAVDAGALSAGLASNDEYVQARCAATTSFVTNEACNGASVAFDVINQGVAQPFTLAQFADLARCPDGAFPTEFQTGGGNTGIVPRTNAATGGLNLYCIRFNRNLSKVRIILPLTNVDTAFGGALGRLFVPVGAVAEAEVVIKNPGTIIPFAIGPTGAASSFTCLFSAGGGNAQGICTGPAQGNFGYMLPYFYGDDDLGTPIACTSVSGNPASVRIAATIAKGSDHSYQIIDAIAPVVNDRAECPNKTAIVENVDVQTGGNNAGVEDGFFFSALGTEGRLLCKDGDAAEPDWFDPPLASAGCRNIHNGHPENIDNTPLWSFLANPNPNTELNAADQNKCGRVGSGSPITVNDTPKMTACLEAWRRWELGPDMTQGTADDRVHMLDLFTPAIASSPRFAWVPSLNNDPQTGGSGFYDIIDFIPIYIQSTWFSNPPGQVAFFAGETPGWPALNGNKALTNVGTFILTRNMLPGTLKDFPNQQSKLQFFLSH